MNCIELPPKYLDDDGVLSQLAASDTTIEYPEPSDSAITEEDVEGYLELLSAEPYDVEEDTFVDIFDSASKECLSGSLAGDTMPENVEAEIQALLETETPVSEAEYQEYIEALQKHRLQPIRE